MLIRAAIGFFIAARRHRRRITEGRGSNVQEKRFYGRAVDPGAKQSGFLLVTPFKM
jgi:hypothetical protein